MNTRLYRACLVAALAVFGTGISLQKARAQPQSPADVQPGVQVLTRGPVHEAFAETVSFNPEPGMVASKAPREIIEEVPPDQRPEGANVTWIPGYWAWDDEQSDYLWVSGIWRALPPGRQWMPGYWGQVGQGYQWTSGYWADAKVNEVEYLPEPPESVEVGPNIAAPSPNHGWMPGSWVWHQGRYAWRPGYWEIQRPDWDWVPAHYIWAPRGYVYSDGYWDYSVERRGVLFAPVYFEADVYSRHGYTYSPSFAINIAVFSDSLFLRPHYQHYYFGDYYDTRYQDTGFFASFSYQSSRHGYDPIYEHRRWEHRDDRDWEHHDRDSFAHCREFVDARPPRTLALQISLSAGRGKSGDAGLIVAASFDQLAKRKDGPMRFQSVATAERQQLAQRGHEVQKSGEERRKLDGSAAGGTSGTITKGAPTKVKLPQSPIVGKPAGELATGQAPPKAHEAPKPDPKVEPKARKPGGKPETPGGPAIAKKTDPGLATPRSEPKMTKGESQPQRQEPLVKKAGERSEPAKANPEQPKPRPQPKAEPPKQAPKPESPKQTPKPEQPRQAPNAEPSKPTPKPEQPKQAPKPEQPRQAPKPEPSKPVPKPEPESKEKPRGEPKEKP